MSVSTNVNAGLTSSTGLIRSCCNNLIEPRLVHVREDSGQGYFLAVWRCPSCHRTTQ